MCVIVLCVLSDLMCLREPRGTEKQPRSTHTHIEGIDAGCIVCTCTHAWALDSGSTVVIDNRFQRLGRLQVGVAERCAALVPIHTRGLHVPCAVFEACVGQGGERC